MDGAWARGELLEEPAGLGGGARAVLGAESGTAALAVVLDGGGAPEGIVGAHQAQASVLRARIHADRLFVPVDGRLTVIRLALPGHAQDLAKQSATQFRRQRFQYLTGSKLMQAT